MREEEEEREEGMLFFSFLLLSTSRDLSQLDSEDIIIHHRETKEQENLKFLPEEQFFASLSHGIPPSSPFSYRDWSLVGLCLFPLILDIAIY